MRLHEGLLLAASLCLALPAARADDAEERVDVAEVEAQDATPFGAVVARNWDSWSAGRGTVSKDDLITAIARPEFRGEDAAALAALEYWARKNSPVSREAAIGLDDPKTLKRYRTGVAKLRGAHRVLFASGAPDFSRLQQGPAGDCYFFAGAGWIALYRPHVIVKAIVPLPDGRFQVTFPDGVSAVVTPPTDSELAANDSASTLRDGLWMPILEKATGTIMARYGGPSSGIPDPTLAIDVPGGPKFTVERFTGRRASTHRLGEGAHHGKIREALEKMHRDRRMAEVLIRHRPPARSIPWNHVYAVLDFEAGENLVVLWNPWGTDFHPDGPSGAESGYERNHGVFKIPLKQFIEFFTFLAIEGG